MTVLEFLKKHIDTSLSQKDTAVTPNLSVFSQTNKFNASSATLRSKIGRFGHLYRNLPSIQLNSPESCQRIHVLEYLATECSMVPSKVENAVRLLEKAASRTNSFDTIPLTAYTRLQESCTPTYEWLFHLVIQDHCVEGMQSVLEIREDLLRWIPCLASTDEQQAKLLNHLKRMDTFLQQLISSWMVPGLVEFRRLTYEETSASILEVMVRNEAVHPVASLEDLRNRLGPGRRVFALFHHCLPDEPLFVLYVALRKAIPVSMHQIHSIDRNNFEERPSVATFYSISNLRSGLGGMGLAENLIQNAVEHIQATIPSIETFCTFSPMPTFRTWLTDRMSHPNDMDPIPLPSSTVVSQARTILGTDEEPTASALVAALDHLVAPYPDRPNRTSVDNANNITGYNDIDLLLETLRPWLMECAAHYLAREKHRRKPLDRVARFHIGNGAILDRLHWKADLSRKGWISSWGVMVTYRYDLDLLSEHRSNFNDMSEDNASTYQIPVGDDMESLLGT